MKASRPVQLVLAPDVWERVRPLLVDHGRYLVGRVRWRSGTGSAGVAVDEELVDQVELCEQLPQGIDHPPLDDYLVLAVRHDPQLTAAELLRQLAPRPSQWVTVLLLDARAPERWEGVVYREEHVQPLAGFRVAGAGMLTVEVDTSAETTEFAPTDHSSLPHEGAFSRLAGAVGPAAYRKLRRAVVTQIGVSRTGTLAAQHFAALGVSLLRLVDPQRVELENLDGMPGVPRAAVGRAKVDAVAELLLAQRPDLAVTCCPRSLLDPESSGVFRSRTDLIVTCVDDETARVAATIQARRLLVPHLDLATSVIRAADGSRQIVGDARLFLPGQGCAACVPPLSAEERERVLYELASPPGALRRGEPLAWHEQRAGSLLTINALTVAAGVQAWLDLLAGTLRQSLWQRLDWLSGSGLQVRTSVVGASRECVFCHTK